MQISANIRAPTSNGDRRQFSRSSDVPQQRRRGTGGHHVPVARAAAAGLDSPRQTGSHPTVSRDVQPRTVRILRLDGLGSVFAALRRRQYSNEKHGR